MCPSSDRSLEETLLEYARSDLLPMHMPGHKRRGSPSGENLPFALDVTEVEGMDDLHDAHGILAEGMARAAALYGSDRAFYLVGGSTVGILAAIRAAVRPGDAVILARNCHRSVYHAAELCRLRPHYLMPSAELDFGVCASVSPDALARALEDCPDARLAVITSPTYEGVISDVAALASLCHKRGIPLLVDQAHGAHLGFGGLPAGAVAVGADLVVQSLHKTLPSLTQTALLHVSGNRIDSAAVERQLSVFETSSPSYPLMASIDRCVRRMDKQGEVLARSYLERLEGFDRAISSLRALRLLCHGGQARPACFYDYDPGKVFVSCRGVQRKGRALTGRALAGLLREEYRIETEMATAFGVLAMTSMCDTRQALGRLSDALLAIDRECEPGEGEALPPLPPLPEAVLSIEEALLSPAEALPAGRCAGRISAEYVWAYPPGVPLLVPGERISPAMLGHMDDLAAQDVSLRSTSRGLPDTLQVIAAR